ncbi:hypothetical protein [Halorubellus sp. PRR65]|uniref:hypothetical protein n=1 Tax=Halorubellus sp. PRR65 TaxID=3098148 RepID=UPI002B258F52|nr:hypothetical protein [Halorubellus sp. PRR65]
MAPGTDSRTLDVVYRCFEHPLRRAVLRQLVARADETATLDGLVTALDATTPHDVEDIRIGLYHVHLPMLDDLDAWNETVRYRPNVTTSRVIERELSRSSDGA